jgi:hypothetical protein
METLPHLSKNKQIQYNRLLSKKKMVKIIAKISLIGIVFVAIFAISTLIISLLVKLYPDVNFWICFFVVFIPVMSLGNKFILSPIEFYLGIKSFQYDSWYERKIKQKKA